MHFLVSELYIYQNARSNDKNYTHILFEALCLFTHFMYSGVIYYSCHNPGHIHISNGKANSICMSIMYNCNEVTLIHNKECNKSTPILLQCKHRVIICKNNSLVKILCNASPSVNVSLLS